MAEYGIDNQTYQDIIANVESTEIAIFKWEWWKICLLLGFYTISATISICGQAMIIIYIARYAPKQRPINRMILIDQVCKVFKKYAGNKNPRLNQHDYYYCL